MGLDFDILYNFTLMSLLNMIILIKCWSENNTITFLAPTIFQNGRKCHENAMKIWGGWEILWQFAMNIYGKSFLKKIMSVSWQYAI